MTGTELFERKGWLADRSPEVRDLILSGGRRRAYGAGEALYRFDESPEGMYGLISGSVSVSIPNDIGSDYVIYQATPGFWIGDLALFAEQTRLVTVTAVTESQVYFIPRGHLSALVAERPEILRDFYDLTHNNMALQMQLLANMAIPSSEKRVAAFLLNMHARLLTPEDWLDLPQDRLAAMVALSVPTVQRVLKRMAEKDLVQVGYGRIRVVDPQALSAFAAE